jgi:hypothetical protein
MVTVQKSSQKHKKWMVVTPKGRTVHFGDDRYQDFTQHGDEERKNAYLRRHASNENWEDPETAGFWARWLLWNKSSLRASLADVRRRFKL